VLVLLLHTHPTLAICETPWHHHHQPNIAHWHGGG